MKSAIEFISQCGLEVALCALFTTLFTGLLKLPLKKLASKSRDCKRITKYITFLPIMIGFRLVTLYVYLESGVVIFEEQFFSRWLSSVSLSLAIYAVWEKFAPSRKQILSEAEISANRALIREIESFLQTQGDRAPAFGASLNIEKEEAEAEERSIDKDVQEQDTVSEVVSKACAAADSVRERANNPRTTGKIILRGGQNVKAQ